MYSRSDLVLLARVYIARTGVSPSALGVQAARNDRLFWRLFDGLDCYASSVEDASKFFFENWPEGLDWPLPDASGWKPAWVVAREAELGRKGGPRGRRPGRTPTTRTRDTKESFEAASP